MVQPARVPEAGVWGAGMAAHDAQQVRECMGKFSVLEVEMATIKAQLGPLKEAVGNFRNLDRNVSEFMTEFRTHRNDEENAEKKSADAVRDTLAEHNRHADRKVNIVIAVCAFLTLVFGLPAVLSTIVEVKRELFHNELHLPKLLTPKGIGQLYTARTDKTQDALSQFPTVKE
jgi:hypothetical protein